jgi:vitamin B12 transporter
MKNIRLAPLFLAMISASAFSATEELIVTGSYNPVTNEQLSSSVSAINKDELLRLSSTNVIDALRQIPSLWVEEQGGPGGVTSIALRGAEANHTLVLLDGVQLNDPTNTRGGAFDLNSINIESIERIEIIRGAQSAIYGSDALAGVIHIITQAPDKATTSINGTVGNDDYSSVGVSTSGKINNLGYAFSAQSKDAGEPVPGSTAKNTEFTSRLNWQQENHTVNFSYRYFDGERTSFPEQSGGPKFAIDRNLDRSEYTDQNAGLGWTMQVNEMWQSRVQASWYQREETTDSPGIVPYFPQLPPNGSEIDFERTSASWINTLGDKSTLWFNLGLEHKREEGTNLGYMMSRDIMALDFSLTRETNSAFINANAYLTKDWLVQASWRHDDPDNYSAEDTTQFGTRYQLTEQVALFANWGEGFKLPSFFALGHPMTGNADLEPETAKSGDVGIEFSGEKISSRISYFDHHYRNLIDFDAETFRNVNRSRVEISGAESEFSWQVQSNLKLRAHASYTDIDMMSSDNHLLGRPQVTYGTSAHYDLNDAWQFNVNYLRVDDRFAASLVDGSTVEQVLDAHNRVDANIHWQMNTNVRFGLSLENLTDENYYTDVGFPAAGQSAKLNVVIKI